MDWRATRDFLNTWQGYVTASIAVLGTVFGTVLYGPRKFLETKDWYLERFRDRQVEAVLRDRQILSPPANSNFGSPARDIEIPYPVKNIAVTLNRSEASIERSLIRLEKNGKAEHFSGGWRLKHRE